MNPSRQADLERRRASLYRQLAAVSEELATELEPRDDEAPKTPRPAYVAPGSVGDTDRAAGARALRGKGYEVRSVPPPRRSPPVMPPPSQRTSR